MGTCNRVKGMSERNRIQDHELTQAATPAPGKDSGPVSTRTPRRSDQASNRLAYQVGQQQPADRVAWSLPRDKHAHHGEEDRLQAVDP